MYSRYGENSNRPVRLPEHYGGSAFSQGPTEPITVTKREQAKPYLGGVGEKASPIAERMLHADTPEELHEDTAVPDALAAVDEKNEECSAQEPAAPTPSFAKKTGALPPLHFEGLRQLLGGGEGKEDHDRLLLLGLILLLSRSGEESDILLWLSLLLLCG